MITNDSYHHVNNPTNTMLFENFMRAKHPILTQTQQLRVLGVIKSKKEMKFIMKNNNLLNQSYPL